MKKESDFNRIEDLLNRNNDQMGELIESQNNEISEESFLKDIKTGLMRVKCSG